MASRLEQILVVAKIIEGDPASTFVTAVTIANNQQNPVPPWALRAMDRRQVDLADKFRDELRIYYSRQEGAFEALSDDEREEMGIESPRDLRIKLMAQTLLALQGEVVLMRQLPEVFENQRTYEATFHSRYLAADGRGVVLAYKVGLMLGRIQRQLREGLPLKYDTAVSMSKNLAWALIAQALLNDKRYQQLLEDYGTSLTKEASFGDLLQQLTRTRLIPILKHVIALPPYHAKVEVGRFDFLRTNEAYKRSMQFAGDQFGWIKKSV